jgi:hypothetical protein
MAAINRAIDSHRLDPPSYLPFCVFLDPLENEFPFSVTLIETLQIVQCIESIAKPFCPMVRFQRNCPEFRISNIRLHAEQMTRTNLGEAKFVGLTLLKIHWLLGGPKIILKSPTA